MIPFREAGFVNSPPSQLCCPVRNLLKGMWGWHDDLALSCQAVVHGTVRVRVRHFQHRGGHTTHYRNSIADGLIQRRMAGSGAVRPGQPAAARIIGAPQRSNRVTMPLVVFIASVTRQGHGFISHAAMARFCGSPRKPPVTMPATPFLFMSAEPATPGAGDAHAAMGRRRMLHEGTAQRCVSPCA